MQIPRLQADIYENARQVRDARFDGRFFIGVLTTGIYCRPVCPVRLPKQENVQLYATAASAAEAGFRPCLRCRPESSPGTPAWLGSSWKVSRALQLIDQGFLDEGSVDELARRLDVGGRQLSRLFQDYLGASPVSLAQTRRLHFAKKLIDETSLPLSEVCFAAGFGSVRRFNAVFNKTYGRSPNTLRKAKRNKRQPLSSNGEQVSTQGLTLSLSYRPPLDWKSMLAFLAFRAVPEAEYVDHDSYSRTIRIDGQAGDFTARFSEDSNVLSLRINFPETKQLVQIVERVRVLFDLKADSNEIAAFLSQDKDLAPLVSQFPGLRVPGCWDGFEVSVRAILGQQVSVKSASTLAARVAMRHGDAYSCNQEGLEAHLTRVFPGPEKIMNSSLDDLGIVTQRIAAIKAVASSMCSGELSIDSSANPESFVDAICEIKGIGPWTAQYIALRSLNDPNAFPHADLILLRAAAAIADKTYLSAPKKQLAIEKIKALTPKQLLLRADVWQPWRAYVVFLLWTFYQQIADTQHDK